MTVKIINSDCLQAMKEMDSNSIDFIVTDSPYGISFMSNQWDKEIPPHEYWKEMLRIIKPGGHLCAAGLPRMVHRLGCIIEDSGWIIRDMIMHLFGQGFPKSHNKFGLKGYGTALKPAWEGWILAMKPIEGTYAQNAEKWGIGGINIDESRIGTEGTKRSHQAEYPKKENGTEDRSLHWARSGHKIEKIGIGRWPSNLILDESTEQIFGDSGGASRFFYCAKASSSERNAGLDKLNSHPTVKPISLMKYIIKLLAPPNNPTLLDPFMGSGTTLIAAKELGFNAIGIEINSEYCEIAKKRIEYIL